MTASSKNQQLVEGLRALAAFVEANDDFEFVPGIGQVVVKADFYTWYLEGDEARKKAIADLTRRLTRVGKVEKLFGSDYAWIRLMFGPHVQFDISTNRELICERVVVGKKVIPAQPERVIPAEPERTVEEVEWRCQPVLTAGASHVIEGEMRELEAGTDPAALQLEAVTAGSGEDSDVPF